MRGLTPIILITPVKQKSCPQATLFYTLMQLTLLRSERADPIEDHQTCPLRRLHREADTLPPEAHRRDGVKSSNGYNCLDPGTCHRGCGNLRQGGRYAEPRGYTRCCPRTIYRGVPQHPESTATGSCPTLSSPPSRAHATPWGRGRSFRPLSVVACSWSPPPGSAFDSTTTHRCVSS